MALRYLRARRQEGFISVIATFSFLGIGLGVATLIIVMSVMNGFRAELLDRILGLNGHYEVRAPAEESLVDYGGVVARLSAIPDVRRVTPIVEGQVMASGKEASGALVRGISPNQLASLDVISTNIVDGSLETFGDDNSIVLGYRLARTLGVAAGDKVKLISANGTPTAFGTMPRVKTYDVAALFDTGMYEYDSGYIYMSLTAAQSYFRLGDGVTALEVYASDPEKALEIRREIIQAVNIRAFIYDWQQSRASFFNALEVERNVMFLILTLIILVAAFNIISSLIMLVKDKGRDIAILRTMGATRGMIMRVFFISGASIGVIGTAFGFALGLGFCANIDRIKGLIEGMTGAELFSAEIYFLSHLPAKIDPVEVTTVVIMALVISLLATIYPSWRAARLDPVEALRYE
ncbi:lipoprotein-releasing ABC transporter permease subunit [Sneathiella chungangensis]|uniref:Lipoprotein-releasing ABC transporter permease subunit n=1 Tax=Sneathiella chungangensis TaxID=1418234 RepID=A0A845M9R6_9PROT|nr:lipoprotein-releasing ABC transporter permease subunit [Sneathiella chungangensis]MZR20995.1 lipoprotein-releasing ABC transporter permease subunit [Sneathiella chungangensis]